MTDSAVAVPAGEELLAEADALMHDVVSLRRQLHACPEVGLHLPRTQHAVLSALDGLDLNVFTGQSISSVIAVLDGDRTGPTTLLRADMDALPITEETGLDYASRTEGVMHACGHDAHTAMLVGAARLLARRRRELAGRVIFMFQPGEEGAGGARAMLDEGLVDRYGSIDRAFALHVTQLVPSGVVTAKTGTMLASSDAFDVVITGSGGHASMPHDAVDPITVACELVTALQSMVTRRIPAFDPAVVTVGSIQAGTTSNVIPRTAHLRITIRAVTERSRELAIDGLHRVAAHVAAAHLCDARVRAQSVGYPATVNDDAAADHVLNAATRLVGPARVTRMATPIMGAEDWACVLQEVPGAMAFLGAAPPGIPHPAPNHSAHMLLDEAAMATGVALHAAVALS
ncbi:amidohydrolase [Streptomyces sp. 150FB]|uniref:M20 metallopeptidase family protein n=1 Tax=Streptomyces sp. 150FB TaxID=1576605 RepID=UPI00058909CA|nr:M20 family metallopeptidase [Streptomyces sp. 150FB]KIF75886.1 amidohydrolase [Streptomyces sp. 150FB]